MPPTLLWEYFNKNPYKQHIAKCVLCKKEYSYKTTSANLTKHLMHKHYSAYRVVMNNTQSDTESDTVSKFVSKTESSKDSESCPLSIVKSEHIPEDPLCSAVEILIDDPRTLMVEPVHSPDRTTSPVPESTKPQRRKRRRNSDTVRTPRVLEPQQRQKIDEALLDMIIQDYQPYLFVEDRGFQNFVETLNPSYELPTKKRISSEIIPEQFTECKSRVMELIQKARNICITIDCWTSVSMDSYFSMTAHFMQYYKVHTVLLHCGNFNGSHTSSNLATALKNVAQEFEIEDKITLTVSDSQDIKDAVEVAEWPFFDCFLHKFNLVIAFAIGAIESTVETVKEVVLYFKKSEFATEALLEYQSDFEKKRQPLRLIQSVPTRWNTVFYMLQRFLKLQSALRAVMPKLRADLPHLSNEVWEAIKQVCMILQPFEEATRVMSDTRYLTASLAIVIVDGLKNVVNLMKDKPFRGVAKTFLGKLEEGLGTYFPATEIEDNMLLGVCTFLDPRFKTHAFSDNILEEAAVLDETCERIRRANLIKEHVLELIRIKIRDKQQIMAGTGVTRNMSPSSMDELESISIFGKIDKNIAALNTSFDDVFTKAKSEMEMFLNEEVVRRDSCPLSWWKNHASLYPNLADIYAQHCHIVVTSVPCENVFSKAGNMLTENRARLSRKRTAEIVFLNTNSGFIKQVSPKEL